MRIAIGNDHRGFELKPQVLELLKEMGQDYEDFGTFDDKSVNYPEYAKKVGQAVAGGKFERGILICGTGIGMCIAANKVKGIRAAMAFNSSPWPTFTWPEPMREASTMPARPANRAQRP